MSNYLSFLRTALAAALLVASVPLTRAADDPAAEIQALRDEIRALSQKVDSLQQQQAATAASTAAAASANANAAPGTSALAQSGGSNGTSVPAGVAGPAGPSARVTLNDQGLRIISDDGKSFIHLGAQIQADSRWYFSQSKAVTNDDAFLIRRARIILDGQYNTDTTFLLMPDFAGSAPTLFDAYVNEAITPEFQIRAGRFKAPVGLEVLQNDAWTYFVERSLVSDLVPNRDIGIQLGGDLFNGTLNYAVGIFDGTADGQSNGTVVLGTGATNTPVTNSDSDNNKDVDARLFAQPFKNDPSSPLKGLGFGISGTVGRDLPSAGLTGYKTETQNTAFTYSGSSVIEGSTWRISPQAYYYNGPFGIMGEYALSTLHARPAVVSVNNEEQIQNRAWALTVGWVLTGEDASYNGVVPKSKFNWEGGGWGAFELVARYDELDLDKKLFLPDPTASTALANPFSNPQAITDYGLGLNWYLSRNVRLSFDFFRTNFDLPTGVTERTTTSALLKNGQNTFDTRIQIQF